MTHDERNAMTPLELAVWAAAYVSYVRDPDRPRTSVDCADTAVAVMRDDLAFRHREERARHVLARHCIRLRSHRYDPTNYSTISCSCGYTPPPGTDIEEMMSLHFVHVGGDVLTDVPAIPPPGESP